MKKQILNTERYSPLYKQLMQKLRFLLGDENVILK